MQHLTGLCEQAAQGYAGQQGSLQLVIRFLDAPPAVASEIR